MIALKLAAPRFEIGQVVKHRRYGYRGVIVEIDRQCCAPDDWYEQNQTQPERNQPWYHVIVDRTETTTYPAESSLEAGETQFVEIANPLMKLFFSGYEEGRFLRNDVPFHGWS